MFRQHPAREWLNFAECDGLETASPLKAKTESADTAEQIEDAKFIHRRTE